VDHPEYGGGVKLKALDSLQKRNPGKVQDWYQDSDGYWINLKLGWQWFGCHAVHEWTVKDALASFSSVEPCDCPDCKGVQA
jgi:hypothetical protein